MVLSSVAFAIEPPLPTVSMSLCSAPSAKPSPSDTTGCSSRHFAGLHQRLIRSLSLMEGTICSLCGVSNLAWASVPE
jgi:hypothetical protein